MKKIELLPLLQDIPIIGLLFYIVEETHKEEVMAQGYSPNWKMRLRKRGLLF